LAEAFSGSGLDPVVLPAFRFEPGFPGFDFARAWRPGKSRLAVFASTRAVEFGLRQLPAGFLVDVQLAAIGPATANALDRAGYTVSVVPENGFTSEALLSQPALSRDPGDAVIFTAPGGRVKLRDGLEKLGWDVRMAFVYRRVELDVPDDLARQLEQAGGVISVWTSASAIRLLAEKLPKAAWKKICDGVCVTISLRLKVSLEASGARSVYVTDGPGNDALSECILQLT
jgi:uroporphyrinogen-III synthase